MADNTFTKTYVDGAALDEADLDTANKSLDLNIGNTVNISGAGTSGQFLKSQGAGSPCVMDDVPDRKGPFAIRNYGFTTSISGGALTVNLKSQDLGDPSSTDPVDVSVVDFSSATQSRHLDRQVTSALSLELPASATLGVSGTASVNIYPYLVDNSGTINLGLSSNPFLDNGTSVTTTAISSSSDEPDVLYTSAAIATTSARLAGKVTLAKNSSEEWQTPTAVALLNNIDLPDPSSSSDAHVGDLAVSTRTEIAYTNTTNTFTDITNLSITIATTGRPVLLAIISGSSDPVTDIYPALRATTDETTTNVNCQLKYVRDSTDIAALTWGSSTGSGSEIFATGMNFLHIDHPSAGTYTYKVQGRILSNNEGQIQARFMKLVAYEL